jgi:hypothetical protein
MPVVEPLWVGLLRGVSGSVSRLQDDKWLGDDRLARSGSRPKEGRVSRRLSPSEDSQPQRLGNIFQLPLGLFQSLGVGLKEQVSHGVLAQRGKLDSNFALEVLDEELVGDGGHDTRTITISCI